MPKNSGAYIFLDNENRVLYVGKARNLKDRASSYFRSPKHLEPKTKALVERIRKIKYIEVQSEIESFLLEASLIKKYSPKYNTRLTDGKAYPFVRITKKDRYPKVLVARRSDDKDSIYFGPYPSSKDLYTVLKLIRKIFPYQSVINHPKRVCLYNHLGLCPCPYVFDSQDSYKEYRKNIRHITQFLDGKTKSITLELEKERESFSERENYEEAEKAQRKINAILRITSPAINPFRYEVNPNLIEDIYAKETESLKQILKENGVGIKRLERIECYDISNISGKFATGSMVVFTRGQRDSSSYRRFRIKNPPIVIPNDFEMIKEVLRRRFKNDWPHPDLIVVDGGKGQVSSAKKILLEYELKIPLIGLAKRQETIITEDFKEIKFSKIPAFNLLKKIRDEAHRFAITYHKKLRDKSYFRSTL